MAISRSFWLLSRFHNPDSGPGVPVTWVFPGSPPISFQKRVSPVIPAAEITGRQKVRFI